MRSTALTILVMSILFPGLLAGCGTEPEPASDGGTQSDGGTTTDGGNQNTLDQTMAIEVLGIGGGTVRGANGQVNHGRQLSSYTFPYGSEVTLTAAADTDSTFSAWRGDCSGASTCTLAMTQRRTVSALFNMAGAWSQAHGGAGTNEVNGLVVDASGNLTLVGRVPAAGTLFSSTGQHLWSRALGGDDEDLTRAFVLSPQGEAVLAGTFKQTVGFGDAFRTATGTQDIFLLSAPLGC